MKVHNRPQNQHLLTEKEWIKRGRVLNKNAVGEEMWTNQFCCMKLKYYDKSETHDGTAEEIKVARKPYLDKQREYRRRSKENKENRVEQYIDSLLEEINTLEKRYSAMVEIYNKVMIDMLKIPYSDTIVIDTETTGLDSKKNELLQVSIIDTNRNTLYNQYIKPMKATSWREAEAVHHISPAKVKYCPSIYDEIPKINAILHNAKTIIGYNTTFDLGFLIEAGCVVQEKCEIVDVMDIFSEIYGQWSEYYESYKWQKLTTCADYYGYRWKGDAHDSLADCLATLYCYEKIIMQFEEKEETQIP